MFLLSGHARTAGILGWPVSHSRSPRLHGLWLRRHGIDGAYLPLPVRPERFADAVRALADLGFRGANVTIPHKEAAFAVCDRVDATAHRAGAVNTLVFRDGRIEGSNTDGWGFLANCAEAAPGWRPEAGPVVILGAGGSARAIAAELLDAGCPGITLVNRTPARAEALARALGGPIGVADVPPLAGAAMLVNTTSLGMQGQPPLDLAALPGGSGPTASPQGLGSSALPPGPGSAAPPHASGSAASSRKSDLAPLPQGSGSAAWPQGSGSAALPRGSGSAALPRGSGLAASPRGPGSAALPWELGLAALPRGAVVADIVYVPRETPLLAAARALGLAAVDGLGMLLHQARPGFAAWFGVTPEVDAELRDVVGGDIPAR